MVSPEPTAATTAATTAAAAPTPAATPATPVGTVGSGRTGSVDGSGVLTPRGAGWSLEWWIGADDRWHLPEREVTVRQALVDAAPVVETAIRVPGGDAVHRAYGAVAGDDDVVAVEVENRSAVPFAVAFVVRPAADVDTAQPARGRGRGRGSGRVGRIELADRTVMVDGRPALFLPSAPGRVAGSVRGVDDLAAIVMSGDAGVTLPDPLVSESGAVCAAFLFPVAHAATVRVATTWNRSTTETPALRPTALPPAASVAHGWFVQTDRGMRLDLPEGRLRDAVDANRRFLLLWHRDTDSTGAAAIAVAAALVVHGFEAEVGEVLRGRGGHKRSKRAAALIEESAGRATADPAPVLARVSDLLRVATATFTWPGGASDEATSVTAAAELLLLARNLLVCETSTGLAVCGALPDEWLGQNFEVHDAPTRFGHMSYAVRWHGHRPALLWELSPPAAERDADADAARARSVTITAPGLDATFSSTESRGEVLLEGPRQ